MMERFVPALLVAVVVGLFLWVVANTRAEEREAESHGGCAEYRMTGALNCWGGEIWKHCEPEKVCVRYADRDGAVMDARKLEVGDVVILNSGGPKMTVREVEGRQVSVAWVKDDDSLETAWFAEVCLHRICAAAEVGAA